MKTPHIGLLLLALASTACPRREARLTAGEAQQALEQSAMASQAEGLTAASVDITTAFTLGAGVESAVTELRAFVAAQLPCADIAVEAATLSIEYGARPGSCTYRGHQLSGTARVTIAQNELQQVRVEHEWQALSNGGVTLDGTATVTWDLEEQTRRVEHATRWTSLRNGRSVEGEGDRVQSLLAGGLPEGIRIDGSRSWQSDRGSWDLAIDGVELRWADPVPQAGSYTLSTPFDKTVSMSFERVDEDTIRVSVESGERGFGFTVSRWGVVEREGA